MATPTARTTAPTAVSESRLAEPVPRKTLPGETSRVPGDAGVPGGPLEAPVDAGGPGTPGCGAGAVDGGSGAVASVIIAATWPAAVLARGGEGRGRDRLAPTGAAAAAPTPDRR